MFKTVLLMLIPTHCMLYIGHAPEMDIPFVSVCLCVCVFVCCVSEANQFLAQG
jgi:hypothetical protein